MRSRFKSFDLVLILCLILPHKKTNTHAEEQPSGEASAASEEMHGWSTFLGPTGDGKSPETGILTEWPEGGLEVVWQKHVGEGYGIGAVSQGRYFHFDRHGDQARLTCMSASTGAAQWTFEYTTSYTDRYGYDGGPRCSPIVDDDRVYLYGAEGMLHCLRVEGVCGETADELLHGSGLFLNNLSDGRNIARVDILQTCDRSGGFRAFAHSLQLLGQIPQLLRQAFALLD